MARLRKDSTNLKMGPWALLSFDHLYYQSKGGTAQEHVRSRLDEVFIASYLLSVGEFLLDLPKVCVIVILLISRTGLN